MRHLLPDGLGSPFLGSILPLAYEGLDAAVAAVGGWARILINQRTQYPAVMNESSPRRCIVNVAVGDVYVPLQERLAHTLQTVGDSSTRLFWTSVYPPNSPSHEQAQYAFKVHALSEAARLGFEQLLWLDAGVEVHWPLEPIWKEISRDGRFLLPNGLKLGQWCSDRALSLVHMTREEAWTVPLITGTIMGFDLRIQATVDLLDQWAQLTASGAMDGAHINVSAAASAAQLIGDRPTGYVSADRRVLGHRHDESVLAALTHQMGLGLSNSQCCSSHWNRTPSTIVVGRGIRPRFATNT